MIFPEFIKKGQKLGVTATSCGVTKELDILRFQNAEKNFKQLGYEVIFTENVFTADEKGRSSDGKMRGEQLNSLFANKDISAIFAAKGGDFLVEMLPYIDFSLLCANPKWIQGYSDNTSLLFAITTNYDIATIYGSNFGDFGMETWELSVSRNFDILAGNEKEQTSFSMYEDGWKEKVTGLEGYQCDRNVVWRNGRDEEEINMSGRLLGGCADVLFYLAGTRYDGTLKFIEKYKEDGIIWFLESFSVSSEDLIMHLWQLKEMGWFQYVNGFVFGRPLMYRSFTDTSYEDAVMSILGDLNVPIVFNADVGHKGPQFTMINGALAKLSCKKGKGCIKY